MFIGWGEAELHVLSDISYFNGLRILLSMKQWNDVIHTQQIAYMRHIDDYTRSQTPSPMKSYNL